MEDRKEQDDQVRGRIEKNKNRDTIIYGAVASSKSNHTPGKCLEMYKFNPT